MLQPQKYNNKNYYTSMAATEALFFLARRGFCPVTNRFLSLRKK